MSRMLLAETEG